MDIRLEKIVRELFSITAEKIDENWTSDDIPEWDSVSHLNLILEIGKEFEVKLEIEDMLTVEKIGDLSRVLEEKKASRGC
jgi:acyl carrier protein